MRVFTEVAALQQFITNQRTNLKSIGLVPTMGALHAGHLKLIEASKAENDITVCSIYVNPTQFNNQNDLTSYPRKLEEDIALLTKQQCDVVFAPSNEAMYPQLPLLRLDFGSLEKRMEGKFRQNHFNGVGIIVSKLFNIVNPDSAYFGQKDIQQFFVIQQLIKDLSFPVRLVSVPTMRELDGLAMSSRNARLSPDLRKKAPFIYDTLLRSAALLKNGKSIAEIKAYVTELFLEDNDFELEYFEVASGNSLEILRVPPQEGEVILCIATYLGDVRLIDNLFIIL